MDKPWETEPDFKVFESSGLRCLLNRNELGIWCGYVAVGKDHPWYGLHYSEENVNPADPIRDPTSIEGALDVHGGVTFAGTFHDPDKHRQALDQVWARGDDWYFGFDCGHYMDYMPGMEKYSIRLIDPSQYKTIDYATGECARMAAQLAIVGERGTR